MNAEEVVSASASEAGVSAVTQRGAVIGLDLILSSGIGKREERRK